MSALESLVDAVEYASSEYPECRNWFVRVDATDRASVRVSVCNSGLYRRAEVVYAAPEGDLIWSSQDALDWLARYSHTRVPLAHDYCSDLDC